MKASELSIGDWVKVLNYYWDGSPYIGQVNGIVNIRGTYSLQFVDALSTEIDMCVPIPLTPEILEKNFEPKYEWWYWGDEFFDIDIHEYTDGLWEVTVWNVEIGMTDCKVHVCCVHELQHALRLAGVEKDVVV